MLREATPSLVLWCYGTILEIHAGIAMVKCSKLNQLVCDYCKKRLQRQKEASDVKSEIICFYPNQENNTCFLLPLLSGITVSTDGCQ